METTVLNIKGKEVEKCTLPEVLFGVKPQPHFLHEVVISYLANQREGSACTKTRSEISGGGRKPWKQKGTGRARQGSNRSPIWRKGGVVFGPKPRSYRQELPAAKRRLALAQALSAKHAEGNLIVVDALALSAAKTAQLHEIFCTLNAGTKPMLVSSSRDAKIKTAGRNINGLRYCLPGDLNAYEVMNSSKVIMTKDAVQALASACKKEGEGK